MPNKLLFVDTNIWLDFYRQKEYSLKLVGHLDSIRHNLITTYVVEMEFLKNRRKLIYNLIKASENYASDFFLPEAWNAGEAKQLRKEIEGLKISKKLQGFLKGTLDNPSNNDEIYAVALRTFGDRNDVSLDSDGPLKRIIFSRAHSRFLAGCPPRKDKDTSIGDAINWEWIIHCAKIKETEIHLVTRDTDYNIEKCGNCLNDYLAQEFETRTMGQKIFVYDKLAEALQKFGVNVTTKLKKAELADIKRFMEEPQYPWTSVVYPHIRNPWESEHGKYGSFFWSASVKPSMHELMGDVGPPADEENPEQA